VPHDPGRVIDSRHRLFRQPLVSQIGHEHFAVPNEEQIDFDFRIKHGGFSMS
jgi:hypothetical protein